MSQSIRLSSWGVALVAGLVAFVPAANAIDVTLSGHVDRMVRFADNDGENMGSNLAPEDRGGSDVQFLDNGSDASRLTLMGREDLDGSSSSSGSGFFGPFAVGFATEMRIGDTSECFNVKQNNAELAFVNGGPATGDLQTTCTVAVEWSMADIYIDTQYGKLSLGKGDSATRHTSRADLSGTDLIGNYDNRRLASVQFVNKTINGGALNPTSNSGVSFGDAFHWYEGSRSQNRIRYDTPVWAGFQASVSQGSGGSGSDITSDSGKEQYAVGVTYAYGSGDDDLQARVAFGYTKWDLDFGMRSTPGTDEDSTAVSASILFAGGFNLTGSYGAFGTVSGSGGPFEKEQSNYMIKGGYIWDKTSFAIAYLAGSDVGGNAGQDSKGYGFYAQTQCTDWWDVYAGLELFELDNYTQPGGGTSFTYGDITSFIVGTKVAF